MFDPHPDCKTPQLPGAEGSSLAVFASFMRANHAHRQLMGRKMAGGGVHPSQMFCLREVAHSDGITQRDLAERLSLARPTLTIMLQKMERAGLIERRSDESDQRFTRIYLTPTGAGLHERMHQIIAESADAIAGPLSEADRFELTRLLGLVYDNIAAVLADSEKADS